MSVNTVGSTHVGVDDTTMQGSCALGVICGYAAVSSTATVGSVHEDLAALTGS